jgi:hypothetical protein
MCDGWISACGLGLSGEELQGCAGVLGNQIDESLFERRLQN